MPSDALPRGDAGTGRAGPGAGARRRLSLRRAGAAAALLAALLGPGADDASAHHILGIPHYRYGDDYPQIPYLEVIAQVGSRDLTFTHFPGFPSPGERVRFKLYVRDRESGEVFREPLRVEVVRERFLGSGPPAAEPFEIRTGTGPERNDYKFFLTFEEAEAFEVRVHFPVEGGVEVIPFPVVIGRTDDRPLIFGAAGLLLAAVAAVGIAKKRRKMRMISRMRARPAGSAAPGPSPRRART